MVNFFMSCILDVPVWLSLCSSLFRGVCTHVCFLMVLLGWGRFVGLLCDCMVSLRWSRWCWWMLWVVFGGFVQLDWVPLWLNFLPYVAAKRRSITVVGVVFGFCLLGILGVVWVEACVGRLLVVGVFSRVWWVLSRFFGFSGFFTSWLGFCSIYIVNYDLL